MPLDGSILGNMAAQQMHALEQDYGDDPDAQIVGAMTIVRVLKAVGEDQFTTSVRKRHNLPDPLEALGMLDAAKYQILQNQLGQSGMREDQDD